MKEVPRYSFNSHESTREPYVLAVRGEKNSYIARGKAREEASGIGPEVHTALSRPYLRAAKRANLQHTLSTPSNRAFPPKSTTKNTLQSTPISTPESTPKRTPKSTPRNTPKSTPRNTQRRNPKNTWKNRSENPSPLPAYTIAGSSSQRQRARQRLADADLCGMG